jgi:hypothetical protein
VAGQAVLDEVRRILAGDAALDRADREHAGLVQAFDDERLRTFSLGVRVLADQAECERLPEARDPLDVPRAGSIFERGIERKERIVGPPLQETVEPFFAPCHRQEAVGVESLESDARLGEELEPAAHVAAIEPVHAEPEHRRRSDEGLAVLCARERRNWIVPAPHGERGRDHRPAALVRADRRSQRAFARRELTHRDVERGASHLHVGIELESFEDRERGGGRIVAERVRLEQSSEPTRVRIERGLGCERDEPVPVAALGQEVLGARGVALDLPPQRVHRDLDRAAPDAVAVPPHFAEQPVLARDLARMAGEPGEELRLDARDRGHARALLHLPRAQIGEPSVESHDVQGVSSLARERVGGRLDSDSCDRMVWLLLACAKNAPLDSVGTDDTGIVATPLHFVLGPLIAPIEALGPCMDAELADLDGNGTLDVALAMEFFDNVVLWNDGAAVFTPETLDAPSPGGGAQGNDSEEAAAFDVDADGDLDLLFVSEDLGGDDELWLREGDAFVDTSDRLPGGGTSNDLAHADLDGDEFEEVIVAEAGPDSVWRWDGTAFVDASDAWLAERPDDVSQDVDFADLDGDGALDLVFANENGNSRILFRRGDRFEPGVFPVEANEESRNVDAGDLDGDGDLDLAVANVGWAAGTPQDRWLENDGSGAFVERSLPEDSWETLDVDLVDLDDDGDLDLVRANSEVAFNQLVPAPFEAWMNDGLGNFAPASAELFPYVEGLGLDVDAGDLDGDGDLDLYLCSRATRDQILLREGG